MKHLTFFLLGCFLFASITLAKDVKFIDGLEDIPLMDGLRQDVRKTVSFGNEESRFVEVYLSSPLVGFKKVEKFYKDSLPQLGWTYQGTLENSVLFYREGEALTIQKESTKPLSVRITIKNRI